MPLSHLAGRNKGPAGATPPVPPPPLAAALFGLMTQAQEPSVVLEAARAVEYLALSLGGGGGSGTAGAVTGAGPQVRPVGKCGKGEVGILPG